MGQFILVSNKGKPLVKIPPEDRRLKYYLVISKKTGSKQWYGRQEVIKGIQNGLIDNGEVIGGKIQIKDSKDDFSLVIVNTDTQYNELVSFAERMKKEYVDMAYDSTCYMFEFMADRKNKETYMKNTYVLKQGNNIEAIYVKEMFLGLPFFNNVYIDRKYLYADRNKEHLFLIKCMNEIVKKEKLACFTSEYLYEADMYKKAGFTLQSFKSSIVDGEDDRYYYSYLLKTVLVKGKNEFFIRDIIEQMYFPKDVDLSKITLKCLTSEELQNVLRPSSADSIVWGSRCTTPVEVGFHYFEYSDIFNTKDKKYLVAEYKGQIVGVIKFGDYYKHQSIPYIDVQYAFRRKGIAKRMIKELNKYLKTDRPLILTPESEMGKMCNIGEEFKKSITVVRVLTYEEANLPENRHLY